jgi:hypothetical protein
MTKMDKQTTTELVPVVGSTRELPPILVGRSTPADLLREQTAATVADSEQFEDEIRDLFVALAR